MWLVVSLGLVWLSVLAYLYQQQLVQQRWQQRLRQYGGAQKPVVAGKTRSIPHWWINIETLFGAKQVKYWCLIGTGLTLFIAIFLSARGMNFFLALGLSLLILGSVTCFRYFQQQQKIMDDFRCQLPDVIDGMIRALRVGAPLADVFQVIGEQYPGIVQRLFQQIYDEIKVGQPLAKVMQQAAHRMPVAEFRFLTIVLSLQQETGGRLTDVLIRLSETIRAREQLVAKIRSVTSEVRNSAKVLTGLPILVFLVLFSAGGAHVDYLLNQSEGQWVMGYVVVSVLLGLVLIHRLSILKG